MKLLEITEPIIWTMAGKLLAAGRTVTVSVMQHARDHSLWHHGPLLHITKLPATMDPITYAPSTKEFNYHISYVRDLASQQTKTFTLREFAFEKLHLYRDPQNPGDYIMSDRKPQDDDEIF